MTANQELFGFYLQDDWNARPNLTLNLGLRYEFVTVPQEVHGAQGSLRDPLHDSAFVVGPDAPIFENPSLLNFAPRFGVAWDPRGKGRTSIRAGAGIFYNQLLSEAFNDVINNIPPFKTTANVTNAPASTFPKIPLSLLKPDSGSTSASTYDFTPSTPYMIQNPKALDGLKMGSGINPTRKSEFRTCLRLLVTAGHRYT